MSHGYAKMEGKPLCIFAHGTVGLQHAAMAIYNAYCDRVPVYIVIGNNLDATKRDSAYGEWPHSVQDAAAMVRDYVKWDDMPISLEHFAESAVRAYKIAMTPPMAPVLLVADSELQEKPIPADAALHIPKLTLAAPPQGDSGSVAEAARLLVQAQNPLIVVDRYARTQAGIDLLVELAETLQAPVIDQAGRMNFPTRHPLNQTSRARRGGRQRRRDHGPRSHGLLGRAEHHARPSAPHFAPDHEERRETDQHHHRRPLHQSQLSGFLPLHTALIWRWRPMRRRLCPR